MTEEYERYKRAQAARWLEHVRRLGGKCRALQAQIEEERSIATGLQGIDYSAVSFAATPTADAIPNAVAKIQDLVRAYCEELSSCASERKEAHDALNAMDDELCAEALRRHYLASQPWEQCCVEMGYSYDGMMSLRKRALSAAYDRMPHRWRDPSHAAV